MFVGKCFLLEVFFKKSFYILLNIIINKVLKVIYYSLILIEWIVGSLEHHTLKKKYIAQDFDFGK